MNKNLYALLGCAAFVGAAVAGCTPAAREDVGQAGDNLSQAAQKSAEGTAVAADKAGDKIAAETTEAVQDTQRAAANAGQDIKEGVSGAAQATQRAAANAGQAVERGAAKAADAAGDVSATVGLTAKVRNAIIADSTSNIPNLNVDTKADEKQVIVKGDAVSQAQHDKALANAKKALADSKSDFKIVDQMTVKGK